MDFDDITRRRFLERSAAGLTAGSMAFAALQKAAAANPKANNPFAYDVGRLQTTDPRLVQYERVGQFKSPAPRPRRLTTGPDNRIYLAAESKVFVLTSDGGVLSEIALKGPARCAVCGPDNLIYAALKDQVQVFNSKGTLLKTFAPPPGQAWFSGMAVTRTDLFVADAGNRAVLRYDLDGKLLGRIGEKNGERNVPGLIVPSPYLTVAVGKDGLLRVNNPGRHRVEVYTPSGDLEMFWGKPSAAIGGFCGCCNPVGIALLPDGRQITCEKGLPRVKVYSAEGTFESVVAGVEDFPENNRAGAARGPSDGLMGGLDATTDAQGRVYVLDLVTEKIHVMAQKTAASNGKEPI